MYRDEISPEMRLFSPSGERLYCTADERARFLAAAQDEDPIERMFCQVLHYTGCRPREAIELAYERILIDECSIVFRCLKKRKTDNQGRIKQAQYRSVPVPKLLIENLDLVFGIRKVQAKKKQLSERLWPKCRTTYYRMIKDVMARADIHGLMATGKGLRHGFGVAMVTAKKPLPIHILSRLMGHSDSKTTEIYLQIIGEEQRQLVNDAWES